MNKKSVLPALTLGLLAWGSLNGAILQNPVVVQAGAAFQVSNLTFDHAMLFNMVNTAIQNSGNISNFSAGADAGVVSVTIRNVGGVAGYYYAIPVVKQGGSGTYNCYNGTVATGPLLQTKMEIQPGQTVIANVSSFELVSGGGFNGGLCQNLQNLVSNGFGGNNNGSGNGGGGSSGNVLSAAGNVVHELLQLQLNVCLVSATQEGAPLAGVDEQACTPINVFAQPSSVATTSAMEVYPNNASVATPLPSFIWTPALYNGSSTGLEYELVLSQSVNGNPWYGVQIPSGQTYYQYQATDRVLQPGRYWWHVVVLEASNGQPVGGQNGQGWIAPQSWFYYAPMGSTGAGAALVTSAQLAALVQANASPAVLNALTGMQLQGVATMGALSDPDVAALVAKPSEIKNISVVKF